MKKFILPLMFLVFTLFYPSSSFAQNSTDCWPTHMIRQFAECSPPHTQCLQDCSFLDTTPKRKVCFEECGRVNKLCTDKAVADYKACVAANSKSSEEPSKEPTTTQPTPTPDAMSPNEIEKWIIDNMGIYEPVIDTIEDTSLAQRKPGIDQSKSDSDVPKVAEINLIPGAKIKKYDKGIMIEISQGGWIYIPPSGEVIYGTDQWRRYFDILNGTVEVDTNNDNTYIKTPDTIIKTKGTHYWVSYDPEKKETIVGVYEGEVEVESKDGKKQLVSPNGDKPGVLIVSQKLSLVKLGVAGLILAIVIGGALFFLKRKFATKGFGKKKK